jgi:ribonucleotide reductase beta subunit family protein with ferritin-like domain
VNKQFLPLWNSRANNVNNKTNEIKVTFDVLMVAAMQNAVFWGVTPCSMLKDLSDYLATLSKTQNSLMTHCITIIQRS